MRHGNGKYAKRYALVRLRNHPQGPNMAGILKVDVAEGITFVSIPEADLHIQCGCPADSVKHLMKRGLIKDCERDGVRFETGPNAILLSDHHIQNGRFTNLSEFPILQMFYRQGRIIPGHPNNTGAKPVLLGLRRQVEAQMEYIYRGNYGLVSEEEISATGVAPQAARQMMRLKLRFAFGKIRRMDEYLDLLALEDEPLEIRNRVFIKRLRTNLFEISHGRHSVKVDLNPPAQPSHAPSYVLGYHHIPRDYFSVLHSGEGDGWDINRPAMASILLFQGKVYLIDAGPNITFTLNALGISVNEIAGIFHTHAHDDHFCGLPELMRADHRIPYYATALVRASVTKKLAALSMMREEEFEHYFRFHDLTPEQWNDIDTLEVKPVFSPHPVETTVMFFRTLDRAGYRTYAHMADIASLKLLQGMITDDDDAPGISQELYDAVAASYLAPADLKKLDIGGGMIHGDAEDFASDQSRKIVLAHTALPLTNRQKEIGSGAPFGTVDVLIPAHQDYVRSYAFHRLTEYFPTVPASHLRVLQNSPVVTFNPESIILRAGSKADCVYLLLTGQVEMLHSRRKVFSTLSAGAMLGELTALSGKALAETYRAANFVQALRIPLDLFSVFVANNGLAERMSQLLEIRGFLQSNRLFGDALSSSRLNAIASSVRTTEHPAGSGIGHAGEPRLGLVRSGAVELGIGEQVLERLGAGDFFCESTVLFNIPCLFNAMAARDTVLYEIPAAELADVPIIRWKLLEAYEARLDRAIDPGPQDFPLAWHEEYGVGVEIIDREHRELFRMSQDLFEALFGSGPGVDPHAQFKALAASTARHFETEEQLMDAHGYPEADEHLGHHRRILGSLETIAADFERFRKASRRDVGVFIKDQVMLHILTEDRKLGAFLRTTAGP